MENSTIEQVIYEKNYFVLFSSSIFSILISGLLFCVYFLYFDVFPVSKKSKLAEADTDEAEQDILEDENTLNKSQRRAKAKKSKKEAKKHEKELPEVIAQEEETPQASVLVMPVLSFSVFFFFSLYKLLKVPVFIL